MKKVAIITGGIRGIGLGIGEAFLKEGYRVVLNYRSDDETAEKVYQRLASDDVICVKADVTSATDREYLLKTTVDKWGCFDVLVNNAAIIRMGRFLDIGSRTFDEVMDCNFYAPFYLSQLFANVLVEVGVPGSIINILSIGAYGAGNISYCSSKAALLHASKCMARELAKHNIRVNCVSPFGVETDLNVETREKNPEAWDKLIGKAPMKRAASPSEIAGAVTYLASDAASFTTGIDIPVEGGYLTR